jgi:hypothetical protein
VSDAFGLSKGEAVHATGRAKVPNSETLFTWFSWIGRRKKKLAKAKQNTSY